MIEHESNIFDKDAYEKIKGVAILLMLAHHMYGFPDFWKIQSFTFFEEISPQFASLTKICVCIFAFLSGYGFSLKKRNLRYVISKILSVLKKYYIYYFIMLLSIICICGYRPTILEVLGDLFMTDFNVMIFCWYIPFYIISIVLLWGIYETYQFCSFKLKLPGG